MGFQRVVYNGSICRLGDIEARAKMFNLEMLTFAISSALAGASANIEELLALVREGAINDGFNNWQDVRVA